MDGEDYDEWYPSYGGGLALEIMGMPMRFWIGGARNDTLDSTRIYFGSGFSF